MVWKMLRWTVVLWLCACAVPSWAAKPATVLYDPGPTHRCFEVDEENDTPGVAGNPMKDNSECADFFLPQRADSNCLAFGALEPDGTPTCPTWRFVTYGWYYEKTAGAPSDFRPPAGSPGYDLRVQGGHGQPITTVLVNDAHGEPDPCTLREVTFADEYPSSSFQRKPDWTAYTLDDGDRFVVSYEAELAVGAPSDCPTEARTFLTTDLIYVYTDANGQWRTNVLSIIHFDAGHLTAPGTVFWSQCSDTGSAPGCRVAVPGPQIAAGRWSRVSLDFKALVLQYASLLGHPGAVPPGAQINAVQVVSSNRGSDSTLRLRNVESGM